MALHVFEVLIRLLSELCLQVSYLLFGIDEIAIQMVSGLCGVFHIGIIVPTIACATGPQALLLFLSRHFAILIW